MNNPDTVPYSSNTKTENVTNYPVWIVAISQTNAPSKTVFVDDDSGKILQTT